MLLKSTCTPRRPSRQRPEKKRVSLASLTMDVLYTDIVDVGGRIYRKQSATIECESSVCV